VGAASPICFRPVPLQVVLAQQIFTVVVSVGSADDRVDMLARGWLLEMDQRKKGRQPMVSYTLANALRSMPMIFAAFSICLSLSLFLSETRAQPVKLTVSYTGVGPINLPVVLAKETGIFARNGLDVTVIRAQAARCRRWRLFPAKWD
jgi:hypothetical protein